MQRHLSQISNLACQVYGRRRAVVATNNHVTHNFPGRQAARLQTWRRRISSTRCCTDRLRVSTCSNWEPTARSGERALRECPTATASAAALTHKLCGKQVRHCNPSAIARAPPAVDFCNSALCLQQPPGYLTCDIQNRGKMSLLS